MTRTRFVMLIAGLGALIVSALWLLGGSGSASTVAYSIVPSPRPIPPPDYDGTVPSLKHPTLSSNLILLANAADRAGAFGATVASDSPLPGQLAAMASTNQLRLSDDGLVQVYVELDGTQDVAGPLAAAGAEIERVSDTRIQTWVPAIDLPSISVLPGVLRVRIPDYPYLNVGSEQTEGDAVLNADDVRAVFGVDGSGYSVGLISDGVDGLAAAQASGDLPAVDTTTCNVAGGDPGAGGAEGTAMLEIVHDVAPGADLMFGNFGFSTGDAFNDTVNCLAAHNDIVVDDIGFFGAGLYDGTSYISENTSDALNSGGPIRAYFTSVGNQADRHYQGDYADSGLDHPKPFVNYSLHSFTSGGPLGTKHDGLNTNGAPFNRFVLAPDGTASINVVWDDPWEASSNDYDLFILDGPTEACTSLQPQPAAPPAERCFVENTTAGDVAYDIALGNYNDLAGPVEFDLFLLCDGCYSLPNLGNRLDFDTYNSSVANQGDAGGSPAGVISLGAVYQNEPGHDAVEFFSSIGPTEDGRMKPDVSAPDGVSITGAGGFGSPFYGTSAASPHAAGVAALLLDCNGSLNRQTLRSAILDNARDIESAGPDQFSGTGHIDALASANAVGCTAGATPTATDTPAGVTATPTNTPAGATATPTDTPGACPVDSFEENDTDLEAAPLSPPVNESGLSVCETDGDWYSFDLAPGEEVYIEALFLHSEGDIDLYLFGPTSAAPVADSLTFTDDEQILYYADTPGTYFLAVDLFADDGTTTGNQYILTVTVTEPIVFGDASCNSDVNAIDATIVLQFTAFIINVLGCPEAADVNLDGMVNAIDATIILQYAAGLIGNLPV